MNSNILKNSLAIGIMFLLVFSSITSMSFGYSTNSTNGRRKENHSFDFLNKYHVSESQNSKYEQEDLTSLKYSPNAYLDNTFIESQQKTKYGGPTDFPWPMYCRDLRHTGRSPYSTADNSGIEKWRFDIIDCCEGSPVIDNNGVIYIGSSHLYAIYPNGTLKWKYNEWIETASAPAIDKNGVLYVGNIWAMPNYLYAIYTSNGTLKWKYPVGESIFSSPAIGDDGSIYFGSENDYIYALYPNGTLKWKYLTSVAVYSSPAIGGDGTIYCGSHDCNLYALYPNNGSLKWAFHTDGWIRTSPCIADDGTIYCVSLDNYLYAIHPNGTMKWRRSVGAGTSPTIGCDGTIYCGYSNLYAINPTNGSVKWTFNPGPGRTIQGGTPCNSADGTIYFGTNIGQYDGGELIAVNPDGTERWRIMLATDWIDSASAIGSDGTVYVGSWNDGSHPGSWGYLHAVGKGPLEAEADGPYYGLIIQPVQFTGSATGGYRPYSWLWNFGDGQTSTLQNPTHSYTNPGNYTVTLTVTDNSGNTSSDTTWAKIKESNNPPNKPSISGETNGETGHMYYYTFVSTDPDNDEYLNYYIDWGDGENSGWKGPYAPGEDAGWGHSWDLWRTYTIKAKARDNYGGESDWGTLSVTMPLNLQISQSFSQQINQQSSNQLFLKMLQKLLLKI
jgi:outer membrane protein assembly factor BamB